MSSYQIDLSKVPDGHTVPTLLASFADWLATQEHGAVGFFDALKIERIPSPWDEPNAKRLQRSGYSFLHLPDRSLLALLETGTKDAPRAVVLLGSEGEAKTLASSLEDFLFLLSKGTTGIPELDDKKAGAGRPALKSWLEAKRVTPPKTDSFDFRGWLLT